MESGKLWEGSISHQVSEAGSDQWELCEPHFTTTATSLSSCIAGLLCQIEREIRHHWPYGLDNSCTPTASRRIMLLVYVSRKEIVSHGK